MLQGGVARHSKLSILWVLRPMTFWRPARWLTKSLFILISYFDGRRGRECIRRLWGIVRQQLLLDPSIPFNTHSSPACAIV